ncbi:P-loop containing nucleoside triphosphate hydrolase protein [Colletotrichum sp. SAR 10_98]|nr:P-loop containing nucleoside triphosphate hydrolase protein [Colletotrichum sp. SAR 10_98]
MQKHEQAHTHGEDLSEEFFTSVRIVTETHISNAQDVLRSINDALSRPTREQTQLKAELENDLAMQATVKTVS